MQLKEQEFYNIQTYYLQLAQRLKVSFISCFENELKQKNEGIL